MNRPTTFTIAPLAPDERPVTRITSSWLQSTGACRNGSDAAVAKAGVPDDQGVFGIPVTEQAAHDALFTHRLDALAYLARAVLTEAQWLRAYDYIVLLAEDAGRLYPGGRLVAKGRRRRRRGYDAYQGARTLDDALRVRLGAYHFTSRYARAALGYCADLLYRADWQREGRHEDYEVKFLLVRALIAALNPAGATDVLRHPLEQRIPRRRYTPPAIPPCRDGWGRFAARAHPVDHGDRLRDPRTGRFVPPSEALPPHPTLTPLTNGGTYVIIGTDSGTTSAWASTANTFTYIANTFSTGSTAAAVLPRYVAR
jgi:hypothetical protein